jgi:hypothetical protein
MELQSKHQSSLGEDENDISFCKVAIRGII